MNFIILPRQIIRIILNFYIDSNNYNSIYYYRYKIGLISSICKEWKNILLGQLCFNTLNILKIKQLETYCNWIKLGIRFQKIEILDQDNEYFYFSEPIDPNKRWIESDHQRVIQMVLFIQSQISSTKTAVGKFQQFNSNFNKLVETLLFNSLTVPHLLNLSSLKDQSKEIEFLKSHSNLLDSNSKIKKLIVKSLSNQTPQSSDSIINLIHQHAVEELDLIVPNGFSNQFPTLPSLVRLHIVRSVISDEYLDQVLLMNPQLEELYVSINDYVNGEFTISQALIDHKNLKVLEVHSSKTLQYNIIAHFINLNDSLQELRLYGYSTIFNNNDIDNNIDNQYNNTCVIVNRTLKILDCTDFPNSLLYFWVDQSTLTEVGEVVFDNIHGTFPYDKHPNLSTIHIAQYSNIKEVLNDFFSHPYPSLKSLKMELEEENENVQLFELLCQDHHSITELNLTGYLGDKNLKYFFENNYRPFKKISVEFKDVPLEFISVLLKNQELYEYVIIVDITSINVQPFLTLINNNYSIKELEYSLNNRDSLEKPEEDYLKQQLIKYHKYHPNPLYPTLSGNTYCNLLNFKYYKFLIPK
ncbi:hypothetical protein DLAC_08854 [Tieghemostelium lacteum]|uniref:Uncharacterized protein n=1 Tax=Tieghemostelium lacteum TaxID=361077 RepID=A0A151Z8I7_TIELA|nr:hypothetical protein DLAC_08854 [Tieghemostelium lacteum]|eukprot:KYQ90251.1 hypothetical protein DLAC_08854 [Tieghemostelium lacteum]